MPCHLFKKFSIILILCIGIYSCIKKENFKEVIYDPLKHTDALPLIDSKLSLKDIVSSLDNKGGITEGPDGFYTFIYYDTVASPASADIFKFDPNQNYSSTIKPPVSIPGNVNYSGTFTNKEIFKNNNNAQLEYIIFKQPTQCKIKLASDFNKNITVTIKVNSLTKNNIPLTQSFNLTPSNSSQESPVIDLDGYTLNLVDGSNFNTFNYTVDYTITANGNPVLPTQSLTFNFDFINPTFEVIYGDLGNISLQTYQRSVDITVFNNNLRGNVLFEDAKVKLKFANSYGVPVNLQVNELTTKPKYSPEVSVKKDGNSPFTLPIGSPAQPFQTDTTLFQLDKTNSNIVDAIAPAPEKLNYSISPIIPAGGKHFITDQSEIITYVQVEIPIKGKIKELVYGDTITIGETLHSRDAIDSLPGRVIVDSVVIKIKVTNTLPLNADFQLYFLDEFNNALDSLISDRSTFVIPTAQFDNTGTVIKPTERKTEIPVGGERYDKKIRVAKKIAFISKTTTPFVNGAQVDIKLFSFNSLQVQVSVLASATIQIK